MLAFSRFFTLDFVQERLEVFSQQGRLPAYFVLICLFILSLQNLTTDQQALWAFKIMYLAIVGRILLIEFFLKLNTSQRTLKWYYRYETLYALHAIWLGGAYAYFTVVFSHIIFPPLVFSMFGMSFFGSLRSAQTSLKISIATILGAFLTFTFAYFPVLQNSGKWPFGFSIVFILLSFIYLINSQYSFAISFVKRLILEHEQKSSIKKLHQQLELEEQLKLQIEINTQNARLTALGEMAAGIAHEINNPLTIITLHIKALDKKKTEQGIDLEAWEQVKTAILTTIKRVSEIISSLRSLAKVDEVKHLHKTSIRKIIDGYLVLIKKKFEHANIPLNIIWEVDSTVQVMASEIALGQVLLNLLQNSFYEMNKLAADQERWCEVKITTEQDKLKIFVRDAGKGVATSIVEQLFTPFVTTKPPGEGTGIGLSLSKSMMNKMNGDLEYLSREVYTTFVITLLLADMD